MNTWDEAHSACSLAINLASEHLNALVALKEALQGDIVGTIDAASIEARLAILASNASCVARDLARLYARQ